MTDAWVTIQCLNIMNIYSYYGIINSRFLRKWPGTISPQVLLQILLNMNA